LAARLVLFGGGGRGGWDVVVGAVAVGAVGAVGAIGAIGAVGAVVVFAACLVVSFLRCGGVGLVVAVHLFASEQTICPVLNGFVEYH
jgi:hypothetical protein